MPFGLEDLTVAITSYRRPGALAETLEALRNVPNVEVMLNGSGMDEYQEVVETFIGEVKFAHNVRNLGAATAANRLIVESGTRFVVWATDSCDFSVEWWRPILELLNSESPPKEMSLSSPQRFTAVLLDKDLLGMQGFYDHNFTQVYYEDEDMFLRTLERLGLHEADVELADAMPVVPVVASRWSSKKAWNSIPNRTYFWRKWERVDDETPGHLKLREDIAVRRKLPEPHFPFLALVQERYKQGDYSALPFVYDPPSKWQIALTRATTNPVVTRSRYVVSRLTNPSGSLK